jgi:surface antigen
MGKVKSLGRFLTIPAAVLVASICLSGCENMQNQDSGALLGGATGALAGAQFGGGSGKIYTTAAGAILGAMMGSHIGAKMDEADKIRAEQAYYRAGSSPVGQNISWSNPHSGHHGNVRTVREGRSAYGEYCREFQSNAYIDGHRETVYSTACQGADGRWYAM